ncbi:glycine zipper 2TM domain-containing protein [Sulfurimonas sp. C5]|uniref:glycine zipper 2TM domain-containing protein n=1 Tax=Sulfurimonas sp. C5 TaxID=3036947 RepID=UPI0024549C78|nr:glycine zipper 2TM domain-containing protein [Sulfurimonas sp. C5]MDH4944695.1 glycine zipper 2TM domain-containing protein [Sulfurimonas sp. C5]
MKSILYGSLLTCMIFSGCATNQGPEYDGKSYNQIKTYELGTVTSVRPVVISDDGTGTFIGAIVGTVLGTTLGGGRGTTLTTLAGGLGGAYVGSEVGKANASELFIDLDNGQDIVTVVKGKGYNVGDRVQVIKAHGKVEQVYILE